MSNRIEITPTKFENARTGITTYGYRAHDGYAHTYSNFMESIPDDDMDFLSSVVDDDPLDEILQDMLYHVIEMESGLSIDSEYYGFHEIKHIIVKD